MNPCWTATAKPTNTKTLPNMKPSSSSNQTKDSKNEHTNEYAEYLLALALTKPHQSKESKKPKPKGNKTYANMRQASSDSQSRPIQFQQPIQLDPITMKFGSLQHIPFISQQLRMPVPPFPTRTKKVTLPPANLHQLPDSTHALKFKAPSRGHSGSAPTPAPAASSKPVPPLPPSNWDHKSIEAHFPNRFNQITTVQPTEHDIICGRGRGNFSHPGNKRLLDTIREHKHLYLNKSRKKKGELGKRVLVEILLQGGRFMKRSGYIVSGIPTWDLISYQDAITKVMHSIRDTISFDHKKKEEPPRTLKLPKTVKKKIADPPESQSPTTPESPEPQKRPRTLKSSESNNQNIETNKRQKQNDDKSSVKASSPPVAHALLGSIPHQSYQFGPMGPQFRALATMAGAMHPLLQVQPLQNKTEAGTPRRSLPQAQPLQNKTKTPRRSLPLVSRGKRDNHVSKKRLSREEDAIKNLPIADKGFSSQIANSNQSVDQSNVVEEDATAKLKETDQAKSSAFHRISEKVPITSNLLSQMFPQLQPLAKSSFLPPEDTVHKSNFLSADETFRLQQEKNKTKK